MDSFFIPTFKTKRHFSFRTIANKRIEICRRFHIQLSKQPQVYTTNYKEYLPNIFGLKVNSTGIKKEFAKSVTTPKSPLKDPLGGVARWPSVEHPCRDSVHVSKDTEMVRNFMELLPSLPSRWRETWSGSEKWLRGNDSRTAPCRPPSSAARSPGTPWRRLCCEASCPLLLCRRRGGLWVWTCSLLPKGRCQPFPFLWAWAGRSQRRSWLVTTTCLCPFYPYIPSLPPPKKK